MAWRPLAALGGLLLELREGLGVTGEMDSDCGVGRATVGEGGLCFGFARPGRLLAGVSILPARAAQGLSDSAQDPAHSPPPTPNMRHPHHEIEFIADSNTFKSIYCKITFQ